MNIRSGRDRLTGDHGRARELAARRLDERLTDVDDRWLAAHLATCPECVQAAISYAEDRDLFRSMRATPPAPPRDLWARTSAAIEADPASRPARVRRRTAAAHPMRGRPAPWGRRTALALVPVLGVALVAVAVGPGLIAGTPQAPDNGVAGVATPATSATVAMRPVQVVGHGVGGAFEIQTCELDATSCLVEPTVESAPLMALDGTDPVGAILSPNRDRIIVMQTGGASTGVFLVPVDRANASPTPPATPAPTAAGPTEPATTPEVTEAPGSQPAETTPTATSSPEDASATPTASPDGQASPSDDASASPSATPSEAPTPADATIPPETASPTDEPTASPKPTTEPEPTPTIEVTPLPGGAIEIARDVVVVGSAAAYDTKGKQFAFSARPADGSAGPDVYVWSTGDSRARAVTTDHRSVFAGWQGGDLLVSRVVKGKPGTYLVKTNGDDPVGQRVSDAWRPAVSPDGKTATWWDGGVVLAADGVTWIPGNGQLVLGRWGGGDGGVQVIADGRIRDWESQWDADGSVVGVWLAGDKAKSSGHLSVYRIDDQGGQPSLGDTVIRNEPAFGGFDLGDGRLAFPAPGANGKRVIRVFSWSGSDAGQWSELPAGAGTTVVRQG